MKDKGIIYSKCLDFSVSITELCRHLQANGDYIISKQIIRSATSMGANYTFIKYPYPSKKPTRHNIGLTCYSVADISTRDTTPNFIQHRKRYTR